MNQPTHDFLRKAVGIFILKGGQINHLPSQKVKSGLTARPQPSDKANEETDSIDWLSDATDPNGQSR